MSSAGSPSVTQPDYWWYRARSVLLEQTLGRYASGAEQILDLGSADGPSVSWLGQRARKVAVDLDPRGLPPGGVCASADRLPFTAEAFDVVAAFDVLEHCDDDVGVIREISRVLRPEGRLIISVPAYSWAWTHFDDLNHHRRRYTKRRLSAVVERGGLVVWQATYAFAATFPIFAVQRLATRIKQRGAPVPQLDTDAVPPLPLVPRAAAALLYRLAVLDAPWLRAGRRLPVGSSVLLCAGKRPADP